MASKARLSDLIYRDNSGAWTYTVPAPSVTESAEAARALYLDVLERLAPAMEGFARLRNASTYSPDQSHPLELHATSEAQGHLGFAAIRSAVAAFPGRLTGLRIAFDLQAWVLPDEEMKLEEQWIDVGNVMHIDNTDENDGIDVTLMIESGVFAPWVSQLDNREAAEANRPRLEKVLRGLDAAFGVKRKSFGGLKEIGPRGYIWE
ncbi:MAG: hypothetical protein AAFZ18_10795 [Myxococcota bacterium]